MFYLQDSTVAVADTVADTVTEAVDTAVTMPGWLTGVMIFLLLAGVYLVLAHKGPGALKNLWSPFKKR